MVIPPNSEIVAKFSVLGIRPHGCALAEPARCLIEEYGVVVGHTLVDASSGSGSVLIVNLKAEVVLLPGLTLIGKLVPVAAISVAIEDTGPPGNGPAALPEYLRKSSRALTRRWVNQADNFCETCCCITDMFSRRRGNQLPAGLRQFNMISLRRTPGQFDVAQDGWPRPDSEENRHV